MGHDDEDVTFRNYKKLPEERVFEIFKQFNQDDVTATDDKDLMLLYHKHWLDRGTAEFERAQRLVRERQVRMCEMVGKLRDVRKGFFQGQAVPC